MGRGGVGKSWFWGLEPGSGTKGKTKRQALPHAVYVERPSSNQRTASKHVASISPLKCFFLGGVGGRGLLPTLDASLCSPAEHSLCANSSEACASCQWHRTLGLQISFTLGRVWSGNALKGWSGGRAGRGSRGQQSGVRGPAPALASWSRSGRCLYPSVALFLPLWNAQTRSYHRV